MPRQTALDPFRQGADWSARMLLSSEPDTFGVGFALLPGSIHDPYSWVIARFASIWEAFSWLRSVDGYIYAVIFTRGGRLSESFGDVYGDLDFLDKSPIKRW